MVFYLHDMLVCKPKPKFRVLRKIIRLLRPLSVLQAHMLRGLVIAADLANNGCPRKGKRSPPWAHSCTYLECLVWSRP